MYKLAREWTNEGVALLAASLYMVHPYMLYTFYQRSAYAELIAAAWLPVYIIGMGLISWNGQFSGGAVDFSDAADWSHPPEFDWEGTPPPGVKLPNKGSS